MAAYDFSARRKPLGYSLTMKRGTTINKVLLLERDPLVREGLCELLRGWDFDVIAASAPEQALGAAGNTAAPDFAIVTAPGGDAAEGTAWVGALQAHYGDLPIIFAADRLTRGTIPKRCVRIDWPVQAKRLRAAIADVVS
jgi:CheY-like chemotaxis protein